MYFLLQNNKDEIQKKANQQKHPSGFYRPGSGHGVAVRHVKHRRRGTASRRSHGQCHYSPDPGVPSGPHTAGCQHPGRNPGRNGSGKRARDFQGQVQYKRGNRGHHAQLYLYPVHLLSGQWSF